MPTYTYTCKEHGQFDKLRKISDRNKPAECPKCGKECERGLDAPQVHYKGFKNGDY